jgi:hypothetical protein
MLILNFVDPDPLLHNRMAVLAPGADLAERAE